MFCHNCGTKINKGDKFCEVCGTKVEANTQHKEVSEITATDVIQTTVPSKHLPLIRCMNCDYEGEAQRGRNLITIILVWLCLPFIPLVTLLYFAFTSKYRCPNCHSRVIKVKNEEGSYVLQKQSVLAWILYALLIVAVLGILSSIVLAALNTAREKGEQAQQEQSESSFTN